MGNRAECPVCKSYSSNVYAAIHYECGPCACGCPHNVLVNWNNLKDELEDLQKRRLDKDLMDQIQDVMKENAILKTKLHRLENLFGYDEDLLKPLQEAYKILYNQDEDDQDV